MSGFLIAIALIGVVILLVHLNGTSSDERRTRNLRKEVIQTDQQIAMEYRKARSAMNDATGQSWRNRFE
ncbi:MAG: hypothetical protein Q7T56_19665 [Nocardioidaceae bacterium]|nr:hypothetical protein [Nocardioidaceae bacterium]